MLAMFVRLLNVPVLLLPNDYPVHGEVLEHRLIVSRLDFSVSLFNLVPSSAVLHYSLLRIASNVLVLLSIDSEI